MNAPAVKIGKYTPVAKVNPYAETVDALIAAGSDAAATIEGIAAKDVDKIARQIGEAANDKDRTAQRRETLKSDGESIRAKDVSTLKPDELVTLVYTLGPRQTRPRGESTESPAAVETETAPAKSKK